MEESQFSSSNLKKLNQGCCSRLRWVFWLMELPNGSRRLRNTAVFCCDCCKMLNTRCLESGIGGDSILNPIAQHPKICVLSRDLSRWLCDLWWLMELFACDFLLAAPHRRQSRASTITNANRQTRKRREEQTKY